MAIIATAEVARAPHLVNVVLGAWLLVAPWVLAGHSQRGIGEIRTLINGLQQKDQ